MSFGLRTSRIRVAYSCQPCATNRRRDNRSSEPSSWHRLRRPPDTTCRPARCCPRARLESGVLVAIARSTEVRNLPGLEGAEFGPAGTCARVLLGGEQRVAVRELRLGEGLEHLGVGTERIVQDEVVVGLLSRSSFSTPSSLVEFSGTGLVGVEMSCSTAPSPPTCHRMPLSSRSWSWPLGTTLL